MGRRAYASHVSGRRRVLLSWSSGKDSAWALHLLRQDPAIEVVGLLTTLTRAYGRVSMHGVREALLDAQAEAAGLPVYKVHIPSPCPNEVYEQAMAQALADARATGVTQVAFGDLFLEEIRAYREAKLAQAKMTGLFPLWGRPTSDLAREMVDSGLRATLTCVDPRALDPSFAGRTYDATLLAALPAEVDPCGERGEFHTFAWAGPMFASAIPVEPGEVVTRDGFIFADLVKSETGKQLRREAVR